MTANNRRYSVDEVARRGDEIYERRVSPNLKPEDDYKFVAIDIETGDYEIDKDDYTATEKLLQRIPTSQIWLVRVGQPGAYRIGAQLVCIGF